MLNPTNSSTLVPAGWLPDPIASPVVGSFGDDLAIGDQPWFYSWNSTVSEFWIYLNTNSSDTSSTNSSSLPKLAKMIESGNLQATSNPTVSRCRY